MATWAFSTHAREQMAARGIAEEAVLRVLRGAGRHIWSDGHGRHGRALRWLTPREVRQSKRLRALAGLVVVVNEAEALVITAYWDARKAAPPPPETERQQRYFNRQKGRWQTMAQFRRRAE